MNLFHVDRSCDQRVTWIDGFDGTINMHKKSYYIHPIMYDVIKFPLHRKHWHCALNIAWEEVNQYWDFQHI